MMENPDYKVRTVRRVSEVKMASPVQSVRLVRVGRPVTPESVDYLERTEMAQPAYVAIPESVGRMVNQDQLAKKESMVGLKGTLVMRESPASRATEATLVIQESAE
jgi:hypothetical protein